MRTIAVVIGIVGMLVFSVFLLLAAPISASVTHLADPFMTDQEVPVTGFLYYFSQGAVRYPSVYIALALILCIAMAVGAALEKVGPVSAWCFAAFALLLNVLAIVSIHLVSTRTAASLEVRQPRAPAPVTRPAGEPGD